MSDPHRRFVWALAALFAATLLPIFALNMLALEATLGNNELDLLASRWQQRTRGNTYSPSTDGNRLFKTLRLHDRLAEVDTVVFGSSTAMSITGRAFPGAARIYNFTKNGATLIGAIAEAEYVQRHFAGIKWYVLPLDWSLGFVYQDAAFPEVDLSLAAAMGRATAAVSERPPLLKRMREAVSYPRIVTLGETLRSILGAADRAAAFRERFLQPGGEEYRCPDGTPARDFDSVYRGRCAGFNYDGSTTFPFRERVGDEAPALVYAALDAGSVYSRELLAGGGSPNPRILERLADLGRSARLAGGGLILLLPPLLPGVEAAFERDRRLSAPLERTKRVLDAWARREGLIVLDAGQSERFGCRVGEFVDTHHAVDTCYVKVFDFLWRSQPWPAGLLAPPGADGGRP